MCSCTTANKVKQDILHIFRRGPGDPDFHPIWSYFREIVKNVPIVMVCMAEWFKFALIYM